MAIRKLDDGRYQVDIRPQGADGKRIRRIFGAKGEASIFERHIIVNYHNKDWIEKPPDRRRLTELLDSWWISEYSDFMFIHRGAMERGGRSESGARRREYHHVYEDEERQKATCSGQ